MWTIGLIFVAGGLCFAIGRAYQAMQATRAIMEEPVPVARPVELVVPRDQLGLAAEAIMEYTAWLDGLPVMSHDPESLGSR